MYGNKRCGKRQHWSIEFYSLLELRLGSGGWDLEEVVKLCLLDHC